MLPADLLDAKKTYSEIGRLYSSKTFKAVLATSPVAPTTANLNFYIKYS